MEIKLAGVTFGDCQHNIKKWAGLGMSYRLHRELDNKFDPNAISVRFMNDHLGYIPKYLAKDLSVQLDNGKSMLAYFIKINDSFDREEKTLGMTVEVK